MSAPWPMERLAFCFGIHNHQPVGNFDHVMVEATERSYRPFLERLDQRPELRLSVHFTGSLLEWLRERSPRTFDLLGTVAARGQVELLTGGFYEPILAVLPDHDKIGQIERLTTFLKSHFGVRPRGMWLAERVWEPHLPRVLGEAGVEYVLVDDRHFALAGLDVDTLGGYYMTDEQGQSLRVFPINQRLRYLIPFAGVDETFELLSTWRGRATAITMLDDGEKFGVWPGTHAHVYEDGWLDRFFDRLLSTPWLEATTLADVVERMPASGRIYLPTASYGEMGEWALPVDAARALEAAKAEVSRLPDGERLAGLLRGGFWRSFLVKYPEVGDMYWKMLRLSRSIHGALARRPHDTRLGRAQIALWRGQANDAYWHGIFGGCYLPHLRRAVRSSLIDAEARLAAAGAVPPIKCETADHDGDGRAEVRMRTPELALTVNPAEGGAVTELVFFPAGMDVADVLTRRREVYHRRLAEAEPATAGQAGGSRSIHDRFEAKEAGLAKLLQYDTLRRASLIDGLFAPAPPLLDALDPWPAARLVLGRVAMRHEARETAAEVRAELHADRPGDLPLTITKSIAVPRQGAHVVVGYRVQWNGGEPLVARWGVQLNLTLTAGDALGRYYRLPGQPSLGSRGAAAAQRGLAMVDEWLGCEIGLTWPRPADLGWAPVETVSLSEEGFERIYQGSALLLAWPIEIAPGGVWETSLTLSFSRLAGAARDSP